MSAGAPRRGLGRGLASLIPDSAFDVEDGKAEPAAFRTVPIDEIRPNPEQPRLHFDREELGELAESIRRHGVLAPLVVRKQEGHYVLIAGERRLRAAGLAGLHEVPVVVHQADDASAQLEIALVENLQRTDLDPVESARGYDRLVVAYGYTQEEVAQRVGKSRVTVTNALRLLKLPEFVLQAVQDGRISGGHARALLALVDPEELRRVLARVIAQSMSVRATEKLIAQLTRQSPVVRTVERQRREHTYAYATKLLSDALHTSVTIKPLKAGGGRIVVDYADAEDLERLIQQIRG